MIAAFTYFFAAMPEIPDVVHRTAPFYPVQAFFTVYFDQPVILPAN